jgi:short-subunit dehydrogenase
MMDLHGSSVIVTGASSGIGQCLAVKLARRGARVALAARSTNLLDETRRQIADAGGHAITVTCDVAVADDCRRLVDETVAAFGGVDILVNNAGISLLKRFDQVADLEAYERLMQVNYFGAVTCTHLALPHIVRSRGLIVAISSLTGKVGVPTRSAYAATKHAMQGFFDSLRIELLETGVDVLVVSPGFVATAIRDRARGATPGSSAHRRGVMELEPCVDKIVRAIERRQRELIVPRKASFILWMKLLAPSLLDRIVARRVHDGD